MGKRIKYWVYFGVLIGTFTFIVYIVAENLVSTSTIATKSDDFLPRYTVKEVIDGDTVVLNTGERVRYIGIDSPEKGECFYQEAKEANEDLLTVKENSELRMERDVSEKDKFNRLLKYVYIDFSCQSNNTNCNPLEIFINKELVKKGFAKASPYPPDIKYQETLKEAERYAKENNLGLWGKCK